MGHIVKNLVRTVMFEVTQARFVFPSRFGSRYEQKLKWVSAKFALYADLAMVLFGGGLKLRERVTALDLDVLAWMYFSTASVLRI